MNKTALQILVVIFLASAVAIPITRQQRATAALRQENESLKQQLAKIDTLTSENKRLSNLLARASRPAPPATNDQFRELMKLRGQVGSLRKTADEATAAATARSNAPSVLSGVTQSPEMAKMLRDQQKLGLSMVYRGFAKRANLSTEQTENLNNLLADHVMTNINHITELLKAGKSPAEMDTVFTSEEAAVNQKVKELLGPEGFAQYKEYNQNLASFLTAEQFKSTLPGEKEAKDEKGKQMFQLMQEEAQRVLADAALPPDYQLVPTLNFRNFALESAADQSLHLLDSIYEGVSARAATFLSPEEMEKWGEFRKLAINNNRVALTLNRKMMAPPR